MKVLYTFALNGVGFWKLTMCSACFIDLKGLLVQLW